MRLKLGGNRHRLIAALATLVLSACASPDDSRIALSTRALSESILVGERLNFVVTVTNTGLESFSFEGNTCNEHFEVRDAAGTIVTPQGGGTVCAAVSRPVTLAPGESRDLPGSWSGATLLAADGRPGQYVPAGRYEVRGRLRGRGGWTYSRNSVFVRLLSE